MKLYTNRASPFARKARIVARDTGLADRVLDATVLRRYGLAVRPEALRWTDWIAGQKRKRFSELEVLEAESQAWGDEFSIGQIGAACACGYLDFRFADWDWRSGRPQLAAWYERISRRPSVSATAPA